MNNIVDTFDVAKFDSILARGLSQGLGTADSTMCIEAAICQTLGLPHGDDPGCVTVSVRTFKISLNDKHWSSLEARAKGLRDLGLAQLGSQGVVESGQFSRLLAKKIIQKLLPAMFRSLYPGKFTVEIDRCEREGTEKAARGLATSAANAAAYYAASAAAYATYATYATDAAHYAAYAAAYATNATNAANAAHYAVYAAAYAANAAIKNPKFDDRYLLMAASLALEALRELGSPGIALLDRDKGGK